jgi:hypothetical protein
MKSIILCLLVVTSCATRAPLNYNQKCAAKGLVLDGVSEQSGSGSTYSFATNSTYVSNSSGENISCVVPRNDYQRCQIEVYSKSIAPISEYNEWYKTKEFVNGLGYYALILPGVGLKYYYDSQRDQAINKSSEILKELQYGCSDVKREAASE